MSDDNPFHGTDFSRGADLDYDGNPAELDLMPILERSWMVAKANFGVLLPAFAVLFIVQLAIVGVSMALSIWGALEPDMYWPATFGNIGFGFLMGFPLTFLNLGFIRILLSIDQAKAADAGMLIGEGPKFVQGAVAFVIVFVGMQIGMMLCVVPGLIVAYLTSFTYIAIIDEDLDAFEAIGRSASVALENFGILLMLMLVYLAAYFATLCLTLGLATPVLMIAAPLVQVVTWRAIRGTHA